MPKTFDPDKARKAAEDAITAAQVRKKKAEDKLKPYQDRVKRATDALTKAQEAVNVEDAIITRTQNYLAATATLDAVPEAQTVEPEGVETGEEVGVLG